MFDGSFQRQTATKPAVDINIATAFILYLWRNLRNLVQFSLSFTLLLYHDTPKMSTCYAPKPTEMHRKPARAKKIFRIFPQFPLLFLFKVLQ
jgi:hypothetical protein